METVVVDNMKKECKICLSVFLICCLLVLGIFLDMLYLRNISLSDDVYIKIFLFFMVCGLTLFYSFMYTYKYSLRVDDKKIAIKALFKSAEIDLNDIIHYEFFKNKTAIFFQFKIKTKEKNFAFITRYKNEVVEILNANCKNLGSL